MTKPFKRGDRVYSLRDGFGTVKAVHYGAVVCDFHMKEGERIHKSTKMFHSNGKVSNGDLNPILFHEGTVLKVPSIEDTKQVQFEFAGHNFSITINKEKGVRECIM